MLYHNETQNYGIRNEPTIYKLQQLTNYRLCVLASGSIPGGLFFLHYSVLNNSPLSSSFIADAVVSIYMRELYYILLPVGRALADRTHVITSGMRISVMQVANNVLEPNASMIRPE